MLSNITLTSGLNSGEYYTIAGLYAEHLINKKQACEFCPSETYVKEMIKDRNKKDLIQMFELCDLLYRFEK
jgi:hypothetical protein